MRITIELDDEKQAGAVLRKLLELLEPQKEVKEANRGALDVLKDQKMILESAASKKLKNVDAFFEKLGREGAVVLTGSQERIAVDAAFFEDFKKRISQVKTMDEKQAAKELGGKHAELFLKLVENGLIFFEGGSWKFV
jgi:hypothetical protein